MKRKLRNGMLAVAMSAVAVMASAQCARFPATSSTAFDKDQGKITLPWRTDLPSDPGKGLFAWQTQDFNVDWQAYIGSVLAEVKAAGVAIRQGRLIMNASAPWWIAPWMDFGRSGRERINGLTAERGPDPKDLSPTSSGGYQTWAIGWYNRPGAFGLGQV